MHQIAAEWAQGTPASVRKGDTVGIDWRVSINDDAVAPSNEPVDNVTVTMVANAGAFVAIPDVCLTSGVTPVSALSANGSTLTCNVGTRNEGTSVFIATTVKVTGAGGQQLTATGTIGTQSAALSQIPISNPFTMDMEWNSSQNAVAAGTDRTAKFQWALSHGAGAAAGPNSVTYRVTITNTASAAVVLEGAGCQRFSASSSAGIPWSGTGTPASQTAPFPTTCTLTPVSGAGAGTATFDLTLTGIDYSQTQVPERDSAGALLPTTSAVVASGEIYIRVLNPGTNAGTINLGANAPTYAPAAGGPSVTDDSSNNTASSRWVSGYHTGGWQYSSVGNPGASWSDTLRVSPNTVVRSNTTVIPQNGPGNWTWGALCQTFDTQYVTYVGHGTVQGSAAITLPGATTYYYVSAAPLADPNGFACGAASANWTTTKPADLSTIRAVMVSFQWTNALQTGDRVQLWADVRVKTTASVGQDIWMFGGNANSTTTVRPAPGAGSWLYPNRATSGTAPAGGTDTPGTRYPYAHANRDIMRVVGAIPTVAKAVSPLVARPGDTVTYTVNYSAEGDAIAIPTVNGFRVVDTLPAGMTYVAGSATPAPAISTVSGRQVLTWTFNGVTTNAVNTLNYQAVVPESATPGQRFVNEAIASVDGQTSAPATAAVRIPSDGFTQVVKTSDQAYIPNVDGDGSGDASWTVTLSSQDPTDQAFTDVIDVLPYNGDGRGTDFAGSYELSGPVVAPGATVYYSTATPSSINLDPAAAANGSAGSVSGNTVGWSTTFTATATAVRVIGGQLNSGDALVFTVPYTTTGMDARDRLVNVAEGRAEHTRLLMRTSDAVTVATDYSASLKKYIQDPDDATSWLDANDPASYPRFQVGDTVTYRVSITNTGQTELDDITATDNLQPALGGFTIDTLASGATESHEYDVVLTEAMSAQVVNTACATAPQPADANGPVTINCDPAGLNVVNHPDVEPSKSSVPASGSEVAPGDTVTYRVSFHNTGTVAALVDYTDHLAKVLDDATFVAGSITGTNGVGGAFTAADETIHMSGTVAAGATAVVEYQVTVKAFGAGDGKLGNFVVPGDETPQPTCESSNPLCTEHPLKGELEVEKSADPTSRTEVLPGDDVSYTLTFRNIGSVAVPVDHIDHLDGVLDDATWTSGPTVSNANLTATKTGNQVAITGQVPARTSYTVTYTVTVKEAGEEFGDGRLNNFLRPEGVEPPGTCVVGDPLCTTHPIPGELEVEKGSDPASMTSVAAGDSVDFTLTFRNVGGLAMPVAYDDVLTGIVDDADVTAITASNSDLTATRNGDRIEITGSVPGGATYTVTYTATVADPLNVAGDNVLRNFLVPPGAEPPAVCDEAADPRMCTTHPIVGDVEVAKAAVGDFEPGGVVNYTLTFTHTGGQPVELDHIDDLGDVLDDADWTSGPTSSSPSVTAVRTGDELAITGTIGNRSVVTVTYAVTIKDTDFGDAELNNCVASTDPDDGTDPVCTSNPIPGNLEFEKSSDPASGTALVRGQEVEYTLTFRNTGGASVDLDHTDDLTQLLDDATITEAPQSSSADVTATVVGDAIEITGVVAGGTEVTITYTATVKTTGLGDAVMNNYLLPPGGTPPQSCVPAPGELPTCTSHPIPGDLVVTKSADPASGTEVEPGEVITYTLSFVNGGGAAVPVDYTDYLAAVLDDAAITSQPVASNAALTVTPSPLAAGDDSFTITGSVAGGTTVTVQYEVTVNEDEFGDGVLDNFLRSTDDPPPTPNEQCEDTNPLCTSHPVPSNLEVVKSAEPDSDTPVLPGEEVHYTLTFTNTGGRPAEVDYTDYLVGLLDDATISTHPTASNAALTVTPSPLGASDDSFTVTGDVPGATSYTVSYSALVKDEGFGDGVLRNVVRPGNEPPPAPNTPCQTGDLLCTQHPVPGNLSVTKSSDPESGTEVAPGDVIAYTLTFRNTGGSPSAADHIDYLTGVLDDADLTLAPTSSDPSLTVTMAPDGQSFRIAGDVAAETVIRVRYEVTVKTVGFGDGELFNVVREPGQTPPTSCVSGDPLCTEHLVPGNLTVAKSSDPVSGTELSPGDEVTYRLTFTNTGGKDSAVDYTDYLVGILDDAELTGAPEFEAGNAYGLSLSPDPFSGDELDVNGDLPGGRTTVVTYTVEVLPAAERGDSILGNFLVEGDDPPPGDCVPGSELCTVHPVGEFSVAKSVDPTSGTTVATGDELTYTLTFTNSGGIEHQVDYTDYLAGVLDDAELTAAPQVSTPAHGLSVSPVAAEAFTVSGDQAPGTTATVTYTVQVLPAADRGDSVLGNFLVEGNPGPPNECAPGNPLCTTNPVGELTVEKSADPTSHTKVRVGETVTYRLTFRNRGGIEMPVDYVDYLAGVLDDAELSAPPVFAGGNAFGLSITPDPFSGEFISITGDLVAGRTAVVEYQATVKAAADRGDSILGNFLVEGSAGPPNTCAPGDALCTQHPVGELKVRKSADPASGTTVRAGQQVSYTLTFRSLGAAAVDVDHTDYLEGVLDDATMVASPSVVGDAHGLSVSAVNADKFTVSGEQAADSVVIVKYVVEVKKAGQRGDSILGNFLMGGNTPPPSECVASSEMCTEHPVSELSVVKSSDPASGTEVKAGQVLTYTLTFANTGASASQVDYVDHMVDVLDDATFVAGSIESNALAAVGPERKRLKITGVLSGGQTATVKYRVKVNKDEDQGNSQLANYVRQKGIQPPASCVVDDAQCTEHPIKPTPPGDVAGQQDTKDEPGWLPDTGGPMFKLIVLGTLLLLGGIWVLRSGRRRLV